MGFWLLNGLRTILDTEVDDGSAGSEELMSQIRENIEALFILLLDTGVGGAIDSDPPDDTTGFLVDAGASFADDEHNGRTLLITSGLAKSFMYTIDDTEAANDRIECADDNLYADGVRQADTYKILYDCLVNTDGHNHDDVNSSQVLAPTGQDVLFSFASDALSWAQVAAAWSTEAEFQVYIPANADTIEINCFAWRATGNTGKIRFQVNSGGLTSNELNITNGAGAWGNILTLDVSSLSPGWTDLDVQIFGANPFACYIGGCTAIWKAT